MADFKIGATTLRKRLQLTPSAMSKLTAAAVRPALSAGLLTPLRPPLATPPAPTPPPAVAQPVLPTLPPVPDENPFNHLPFPAPGDRIRADDFRQLSSCLQLVQASAQLSAALVGHTLAAARPFLAAQGRVLSRVMTVFGSVLEDVNDLSLDHRRIVQVLPVIIGEPEVQAIVTEAVETRRLTPSLVGFHYEDASRTFSGSVGQGTIAAAPARVPSLADLSLAEAANVIASQP